MELFQVDARRHSAILNRYFSRATRFLLAGSALGVTLCAAANAQVQKSQAAAPEVAQASGSSDDIIVTARKRNETAIDVPVAITAVSGEQLERYGTRDLNSIATQVPGLIIQSVPGGAGGSVALRGISSSNANPSIDQAVSFNIDGVQVGSANILRLGQIDLQQIEVLKGPQALFFGKNSPGGVISIRTADPGDHFELKASADYEFYAQEASAQIAAGGPVTDTLGIRVVGYVEKMRGYFDNQATVVPGFTVQPAARHGPNRGEYYLRGTLVYKPTDTLSLRAKYGYSNLDADSSPFDTQQRIFCPNGAPQLLGYPGTVDCKADNKFQNGGFDTRLAGVLPAGSYGKGEGTRSTQQLGSVEINYEVVPDVTLTSVSGYYKIADNFYGSASYQSGSYLLAGTGVNRRELSQEIRLATAKSDWPINFIIGGYYQDANFRQNNPTVIDAFALGAAAMPGIKAASFSLNLFSVDGEAYSFFGQAVWNIFDNLELAAGARRSHEEKRFAGTTYTGGLAGVTFSGPVAPTIDHVTFNDTSPEVTLTYKPTPNLSIFGAFRNGFKSGGFNTGGSFVLTGKKIDYRPEDARGFEAGLKTRQGPVRFNLTAYTYLYKDLQVSTFDPVQVISTVVNAASARVKGIESDIAWNTPLEGLQVHAAANYNHARYKDFLVGCYTGQTIGAGCNVNPSATGVFRQQNFKGRQLLLAPDWTGNAGFILSRPVAANLKIGLTGDVQYSSGFYGQLEEARFARQQRYAQIDASVRIGEGDDRWQVALIGRNLTDIYRARFVSQVPLTGIASRTGTALGGGLSDYSGQVNRGREVRLQLSMKIG